MKDVQETRISSTTFSCIMVRYEKGCSHTMAKETRKTKDGRYVLRPGEYERKEKKGFDYVWRDKYGHQHKIGALTLQELRQREREIQRDELDGLHTSRQRNTLNDFYDLWKTQKRGLKQNTYSNYVWMYETFVSQTLGKKRIMDIKESDVVAFYNDLYDKGIAVNTLDNIQTVLHQVFHVAVKDDAIRRNVSDGALRELKSANPREKKKALTPEELERFREVIADSVWYPVFTVMSWTGMRVGEVAGLTWDDIDYKSGIIHVQRTLVYYKDQESGKMERRLNTTKTPASFRELPLNEHIIKALQYQKEKCLPCTAEIDGVSGFVFSTRFKDTQSQQTLNRAIKRIVHDANSEKDAAVLLPDFSCHTLRHTYATNLARAGVNQAITMYLMGHTDISTTVEVYTDVQKDMAARGDEQLRAWLSGKSTAETDSQRHEYDELRNMASEIIRVANVAREELQETGVVKAHHVEQMAKLGITMDDLK